MNDQDATSSEASRVAEAMLSRRRLLAAGTGIGAAGLVAGVAGVTGASPAGAAPEHQPGPGLWGTAVPAGVPSPAGLSADTLPIAQPGCTIRTVTAATFTPVAFGSGATLVGVGTPGAPGTPTGPVGTYNSVTGGLFAALDIPTGSTLMQVDCYAYATDALTVAFRDWWLFDFDNQSLASSVVSQVAVPAGPGLTQHTFGKLNYVVGSDHQVVADLTLSSSAYYAVAVTYQYIPVAPSYYPITPTRVYDSRWSPAPAGVTVGVLTAPNSRVVSVADGRALSGGVITAPNVVPANARAVTYNLTAVSTTPAGYLAITPGDAVSFSASAINWSMAGAIANGGVVPLDGSRNVKVWAGGGASGFIVDITGYYL